MPSGLQLRGGTGRRPRVAVALAAALLVLCTSAEATATAAPAVAAPAAALASAVAPAAAAGALVSAVVLAPGAAHPLAAVNAATRLVPGGAWPVVTEGAALWRLGAHTAVETSVVAPRPRKGTVLGDLVLVGGGNPVLDAAQLQALARSVARSVHTVTGRVLADGALFVFPQIPAGWPLGAIESGAAPPAAALSVNGDQVLVTVTPATSAGVPASVRVDPAGAAAVSGAVETVAAPAQGGVPAPTVTMDASSSTVLVGGSAAVGSAPTVTVVYPASPARIAASLFRRDLVADGVAVQGGSGIGLPIPSAAPLAHVTSPPLATWWSPVAGTAGGTPPPTSPIVLENLFRLLCSPTPARPCGPSRDAQEMLRFLAAIGAGTDAQAADGSGLSALDRISAGAVARVLLVAGLHAWGAPLLASLPPLPLSLPGVPPGATGWYLDAGTTMALVARVPVGPGKAGDRIVVVLANQLVDQAMAAPLAVHALDAAAGIAFRSQVAPPSAAAAVTTTNASRALATAVDQAGPGSEVAATAWVVGAGAPGLNLNGALLLPVTGVVPTLIAAVALGAATPTALTTRAVVDGTLEGTTLHGSIGLVGGLDPSLAPAALMALARQVRSLGVARVTAGVTVDDQSLSPAWPPSWPWDAVGTPPAAAGDALAVGDALYSVAVLPAPHIGAPPTVELVPSSTPVGVTNEARTVSGKGETLALWPVPGSSRLVLTGTIGSADRLGTVFLRTAPDPALAAGRLFFGDLVAAGVAMAGSVARTTIPPVAPTLATYAGGSLTSVVDGLLTTPDALAAWDLTAALGGALRGTPGSQAVTAGLSRITRVMAHDGGGAPPPVLTEPVGVGQDDLVSTYGCASDLATLAAAKGPTSALPTLLPLVPNAGGAAATVRAVEAGTAGQGTIMGYVGNRSGTVVAFCANFASLDRSPLSVLAATVAGAAQLAAATVPNKPATVKRRKG